MTLDNDRLKYEIRRSLAEVITDKRLKIDTVGVDSENFLEGDFAVTLTVKGSYEAK